MKGKTYIERAVEKENKVIGNLKSQFIRPALRQQRQVGISPAIAAGNIALSYYRGLAVGEEERTKEIVRALKKNFPEASKFVKEKFKP